MHCRRRNLGAIAPPQPSDILVGQRVQRYSLYFTNYPLVDFLHKEILSALTALMAEQAWFEVTLLSVAVAV